jgi:tetratricopeptide (TPR) repeat protein
MIKNLFVALFMLFFAVTASASSPEIPSREFLDSRFITHLKKKEYKKALKESEALLKRYPDDSLILRYRALTFEKLNKPDEAIKLYKQIFKKRPDYVPAHLFLGLAYIKQKKNREGAEQLRWVIQNSKSKEYQQWAQAQLNRLKVKPKKAGKPIKKKTYGVVKTGVAYDSNALLVPDDEKLSAKDKHGSAQYSLDLNVGYPVRLKKDSRLDIVYIGQQRSHDAGAKQVDFTSNGFAIDAKKRNLIGKRAVLFGSRYDFRANFLRSDLFSIVNRFVLSADTSFWKKTRTHCYARLGILNYGPDGANPDVSSRDGVRGGLGVTQYFYTNDLRTFFFVKGEGSSHQTRGDNSIRQGALARLGFHAPLKFLKKTALDISTGYDWGTYPEFISASVLEPEDRVDSRFDVYTGVTHQWKPNAAMRIFHRFINSQNENDYFDRTRHIAGLEMIFSF